MVQLTALRRTFFVLFVVSAAGLLVHAATTLTPTASPTGHTVDAPQCGGNPSSANCVNEMDRASDAFNPASAHNYRNGMDVASDSSTPLNNELLQQRAASSDSVLHTPPAQH